MSKRLADDSPRWKVIYPEVPGKSEQDLAVTAVNQASPFHANGQPANALDIYYAVEPQEKWYGMKRYRAFTLAGDRYSPGESVFVRHNGVKDDSDGKNCKNYWIALILEIRGSDEHHVYTRVFWFYWPKELPETYDGVSSASGRRTYHGKHELIASNCMEILDVTSFAGKASVEHWLENDDIQRGLYWRQTFDHRTLQLSGLQKYCTCQRFYNPDELMYGCPSEKCKLWLHTDCLLRDIFAQTCERIKSISAASAKVPNSRKRTIDETTTYEDLFSARIIEEGDKKVPKFVIKDLRPDSQGKQKTWTKDILCLKCRTKIE